MKFLQVKLLEDFYYKMILPNIQTVYLSAEAAL